MGCFAQFLILLKVLNRVIVALGLLHITQFQASSINWELFVNTEVNMIVSSHVHLQGSKSKVSGDP